MTLARAVTIALATCVLSPCAGAAQTAKLKVAFSPDRAGQRTTIELALRVSGSSDAPPSPVTSLDLRMPESLGIATTTLGEANCAPASLLTRGLSGCPANARMGFGTATAVVPLGSELITEKATLDALMGQSGENRIEVLFYLQAAQPVFAQLVLPSVLQESAPPYGEGLDTSVPLIQAWPEGPYLALQTFNSTLGPAHLTYYRRADGRTVAFKPRGVRLPATCPAGGYLFEAALNFQDGTRTTARYRVGCPAH